MCCGGEEGGKEMEGRVLEVRLVATGLLPTKMERAAKGLAMGIGDVTVVGMAVAMDWVGARGGGGQVEERSGHGMGSACIAGRSMSWRRAWFRGCSRRSQGRLEGGAQL